MRTFLVVLIFSSLAMAQTAAKPAPRPNLPSAPTAQTGAPPAEAPKAAAPAAVAPTAPVITIQGVCAKEASTPPAECKTVVTKAEFEKLANALNPQMPEPMKRQLANAYAQLLVLDRLARERGLQNQPDTAEVLRFAQMQALGNLLLCDMQQQASKVPQADIENYYNQHKGNYEDASLLRIFIPKTPGAPGSAPDEARLKAEADKIHAAAARGGDFDKLQKEAYADLGLKSEAPPVTLSDTRREGLPPAQAKVFDLQPGQLSEVLDAPGGFYIYKMVTKKSLPLADAEAEIKRTLEQERLQQAMERIRAKVKPEFNEAYFGSAPPPGPPGVPPPGARPQTPPPGAVKPATPPPPK